MAVAAQQSSSRSCSGGSDPGEWRCRSPPLLLELPAEHIVAQSEAGESAATPVKLSLFSILLLLSSVGACHSYRESEAWPTGRCCRRADTPSGDSAGASSAGWSSSSWSG